MQRVSVQKFLILLIFILFATVSSAGANTRSDDDDDNAVAEPANKSRSKSSTNDLFSRILIEGSIDLRDCFSYAPGLKVSVFVPVMKYLLFGGSFQYQDMGEKKDGDYNVIGKYYSGSIDAKLLIPINSKVAVNGILSFGLGRFEIEEEDYGFYVNEDYGYLIFFGGGGQYSVMDKLSIGVLLGMTKTGSWHSPVNMENMFSISFTISYKLLF
ncbi:hypothetical protein KKF34_00705 [Myxococcota bacterium]|nr:hypothetical protein [Myxococcota bacterium]MBU1495381.1 hypothetical protein [Myxococcota bacterium]